MREKIVVAIQPVDTGYYVDSTDLPELNIFVKDATRLVDAISGAIRYLYKHNRGLDVRVFMEVPLFAKERVAPQSAVELEPLAQAA